MINPLAPAANEGLVLSAAASALQRLPVAQRLLCGALRLESATLSTNCEREWIDQRFLRHKALMRRLLAMPVLIAGLAMAASAQAMETLEIDADSQDVDGKAGIATYEGDVIIRHGQLLIRADKVVFYESEPGVFERAVMTGRPVTLIATPDDGPRTEGQARRVEYRLQDEQLFLEGGARLKQPGQDLSAERIDYDLSSERIRASRGDGEDERVRVRFESREKKNGGENGS
jgi:lipopolysaccharide export system protein LptA